MSVVRTSLSAFPLSGFFTGGVAHGTGSSQNESRTGKSSRNIQHEAGQDRLCGGRSFQPDRKGHAGGQNEAADEGRCEIIEFLMQNSVRYSLYLS